MIYVETPISEKPEKEGRYIVNNGLGFFEVSWNEHYGFHEEFTDCSGLTYWLKPAKGEAVHLHEMMDRTLYDIIMDTVSDLVSDFTNYDRREDEELSKEQLREAIISKEITIDEIVEKFREELEDWFE